MDVEGALGSCSLASLIAVSCALGLTLEGCGPSLTNSPTSSAAVLDTCAPSAIQNRFLVQWKDGKTTVEEAETEDAFQRNVLAPNKGKIIFAEHDHLVTVEHPMAALPQGFASAPDWGQTDVDASDAWSLATGQGVTVAVIDAGVDITHPQLQNQLAVNSADIPGNGIDDDKNGLIDDTYGYDFAANSGNIHDGQEGHGTHVSGIILGQHAVGVGAIIGVNGMAPGAKLLPLNFMASDGSGQISDALRAMDYAATRGVKVINASWGGPCAATLQAKISSLEAKGILFVAAAGNGGSNGVGLDLDTSPSYPAALAIPNQITVGALMQTLIGGVMGDVMTGFSNYSTNLVQLMAPGSNIRSTFPLSGSTCESGEKDGYCEMSGTSMATPFVSGTAALLFSYRPKATVTQVRAALLAGVTPGNFLTTTGGRLNAKKALDALAQAVPQ